MTIGPLAAKYGVPYLVEYKDEKFTGVRHKQIRTSMSASADWLSDIADTTSWIFLTPGDDSEVIFHHEPEARGEDFGEITPLAPARMITRDDLPSTHKALRTFSDALGGTYGTNAILDAVVAHLNERGGIPAEARQSETHINVTADADNTPADFSEKLRKLSEEFKEHVQVRALRDAEGNIVEHVLTPRKFAAGGYVPSPDGGGKSCCKEAELTANELARRNEELSEAEEKIAALTEKANREGASVTINGTNKNGEELTMKFWSLDRDQALKSAVDSLQNVTKRAEKAEAEHDDLQAKLDAAENRPTLDREAVMETIIDATNGQLTDHEDFLLTEAIMDLAAAEGWPDWLGPKVDPGDYEVTRNEEGDYLAGGTFVMDSPGTADTARWGAQSFISRAARRVAVARFIERSEDCESVHQKHAYAISAMSESDIKEALKSGSIEVKNDL